MEAAAGGGGRGRGCRVCGDPNHWAQDCPQRGGDGGAAWQEERRKEREAQREAARRAQKGPSRRRRFEVPRLARALGPLRREVPDAFRAAYPRGAVPRGGEARALRRLLELYQRWQHKAFLEWGFPEFVAQLERVGRKAEVRAALNAVREEVSDRFEEQHPQAPPVTPGGAGGPRWDDHAEMPSEGEGAFFAGVSHSEEEEGGEVGARGGGAAAPEMGAGGPEADLGEEDLNELLAVPTQEPSAAVPVAPAWAPGSGEAAEALPTQTQPGEDLDEKDIQDLLGE